MNPERQTVPPQELREEDAGFIHRMRLPLILIAAVIIVSILSLVSGQMDVRPATVVKILASRVIPIQTTWPETIQSVVLDVRLPRL